MAGGPDAGWLAAEASRLAEGGGAPNLSRLRPDGLYGLALLAGGGTEPDVDRAADLLGLARRLADEQGTDADLVDLAVQAMLVAGRFDDARWHATHPRVDPWVRWALETDLAHPARSGDTEAWLELLNQPLRELGVAPLGLSPGPGSAFDRLCVPSPPMHVEDGPLVTIVMAVHAPTSSLLPAVRSVLDQTWRRLQVIVVDDANGPEHTAVLEKVRRLDPRLEVVRQPVNGGTYRARNLALGLARGELVGFNDADDWVHPQRIERQVAAMVADPGLVATLSRAVRLHADLRITRLGAPPFALNLPSLLIRRDPVVERIGRFDDVRKAADLEYIERIAAVFGRDSVRTLEEPLTMYQLTAGSLSRTDFRMSWHHPARHAYHSAFQRWHDHVQDGAAPNLDHYARRPFPAPAHLGGPPPPEGQPDVVVMADLRPGIGAMTGLTDELEALAGTGARVGVAGGEAARHATKGRGTPCGPVLDLLAAGRIEWTPVTQERQVPVLVLRDPELVTVRPRSSSVRLRARCVVVAATMPPRHGRYARYDPATVDALVRELFGAVEVVWWPGDPDVAANLAPHGVRVGEPVPWDLLGDVARPRPVHDRLVVGLLDDSRFLSERTDRGSWGDLAAGLDADVRVLTREPGRPVPAGWVALDARRLSAPAFWRMCDVAVLQDASPWSGVAARAALDALAQGCVPLVHPGLAKAVGGISDAVVTSADDVARRLARMRDPVFRERLHVRLAESARARTAEGWPTRLAALL